MIRKISLALLFLVFSLNYRAYSCNIPDYLDFNRDKKIDGYDWVLINDHKIKYNLVLSEYIEHYKLPKTRDKLNYVYLKAQGIVNDLELLYESEELRKIDLKSSIHFDLKSVFGEFNKK